MSTDLTVDLAKKRCTDAIRPTAQEGANVLKVNANAAGIGERIEQGPVRK
jgi:hypothetical protein